MIESNGVRSSVLLAGLALILGVAVAVFDVAAPFGDDTEKGTVFLWLIASAVLGFCGPDGLWRWALLVGIGVPAAHFVLYLLGWPDSLHPNRLSTILLLVPVSVAICLLGAYGGVLARLLTRRA
jgi:hypothetical protein